MTWRAYTSITARSSAEISRTERPSAPAAVAAPAALEGADPTAAKSTLKIERFIARPMRMVSSVPEAPTSVPPMIRALLSSSKPVAAAASPVNAFRKEMTTGMSAPPIGSTSGDAEDESDDEQQQHPDARLGHSADDREDERAPRRVRR